MNTIAPIPRATSSNPSTIMTVVKVLRPLDGAAAGAAEAVAVGVGVGLALALGVAVAVGVAVLIRTRWTPVTTWSADASRVESPPLLYPSLEARRPIRPGAICWSANRNWPCALVVVSSEVPWPSTRYTRAPSIGSPVAWSVTMPETSFTDGARSGPRTRTLTEVCGGADWKLPLNDTLSWPFAVWPACSVLLPCTPIETAPIDRTPGENSLSRHSITVRLPLMSHPPGALAMCTPRLARSGGTVIVRPALVTVPSSGW